MHIMPTPMQRIALEEDNIEVMRGLFLWLIDRNKEIEKDNERLRKLQAESNQLQLNMEHQRNVLRKLIFGHGVEKRNNTSRNRRQKEDQTLLLHAQSLAPAPTAEESAGIEKSVVYHEMSTTELLAIAKDMDLQSQTSEAWEEIKGLTDDATEVNVIERRYVSVLHKRKKYRYRPATDETLDKEVIVTADNGEKLIPGAGYSIDFALSVVSDKYEYHLPLERQTRQMESAGLKVGTKTLSNLCQTTAVHMEPVADLILKGILGANLGVNCDETPWPIMSDHDNDGYMWTASNQAGTYYQFEPTRSGRIIAEILQGYTGPVLADGYGGYNRLKKNKKVDLANCWAHARRKFFDLEKNYPEDVGWILDQLRELFVIEREAKDYDQLGKLRHEKSKPLIDKIKHWLMEMKMKHLPQSTFILQAVNYTLNHWDGLTKFLNDTRIPLTNNDAERAMRHAVMGRKNFYGSQTINGADTAATLYTVIESCKKVELDPTTFMRQAIHRNNHGEPQITPLEYARQIRTPQSQ